MRSAEGIDMNIHDSSKGENHVTCRLAFSSGAHWSLPRSETGSSAKSSRSNASTDHDRAKSKGFQTVHRSVPAEGYISRFRSGLSRAHPLQ